MTVRLRGRGGGRPLGRSGSAVRRRGNVRRATPRLSPVRALAILVMLACAGVGYWVTTSSVFAVQRLALSVTGNEPAITTEDAVRSRLGLPADGANLFLVSTDTLAARLRELPQVDAADVTAQLPGTIRVTLTERQPILAWVTAGHRFLVDRDGLIVADASVPGTGASGAAADPAAQLLGGLAVVVDNRASASALAVGGQLDPLDLDVATRLGSLLPADLGSAAPGIRIQVDDTFGYTIVPTTQPGSAVTGAGAGNGGTAAASPAASPLAFGPGASQSPTNPGARPSTGPSATPSPRPSAGSKASPRPSSSANPFGWTAIFGFYTRTIRPPDLIPGQVRALRSLLYGQEAKIGRVILADDRGGTYVPR